MTDPELVAAVAKRLGWTNIETKDLPGNNIQWMGTPSEAKSARIELPPWRTSVDAALGLLDKTHLKMQFTVKYGSWVVVYKKIYRGSNKSLPHAILLAFLESQEEKP